MPEIHFSDSPPARSQSDLDLDEAARGTVRRWVVVRHVTVWHPPTDVYELDDKLVVAVELASMRERDISILLLSKKLTISVVCKHTTLSESSYHQLEFAFGEFRTDVNLPWAVERVQVSATYRDGFLIIVLPHAAARSV